MGFKEHTVNGLVSLVISVVATAAMSDSADEGYTSKEVLLSVAVSAFLSGFFTSFFAGE